MAQDWKKVSINNEISLEFPSLPVKRIIEDKEVYLYKTESYAMMFGVARNTFLFDVNTLKFKEEQNKFLDGFVQEKISHSNQYLESIRSLELGKILGREITYYANKKNRETNSYKKNSILLLFNKNIYTIEFWNLCKQENKNLKDKFFNSILVNDSILSTTN